MKLNHRCRNTPRVWWMSVLSEIRSPPALRQLLSSDSGKRTCLRKKPRDVNSTLLSPPPKAITFFNFLKITFCKVDTHIDMFLQFLFPRTQFSSSETTAIIRFFHSHLCLCVYVRILNRNGNALYSSALCYFQSKSWRSFPISALFFRDIVVFCGIEFLLWLLVWLLD